MLNYNQSTTKMKVVMNKKPEYFGNTPVLTMLIIIRSMKKRLMPDCFDEKLVKKPQCNNSKYSYCYRRRDII